MMHRKVMMLGFLMSAGLTLSCGSSTSPTTPAPSPTPAPTPKPTPVPTPTPAPTPTPCTQGLCEPPVENTNPPKSIFLRLYYVQYPNSNELAKCDASDPIPVGYTVMLDATAKDANNKPTNGSSDVRWEFNDESLAEIRPNQPFQRRMIVLKPGKLEAFALLDGVRSNRVALTFQRELSGACAR